MTDPIKIRVIAAPDIVDDLASEIRNLLDYDVVEDSGPKPAFKDGLVRRYWELEVHARPAL